LEKKPSIRLSQEPWVGVKVNSKRCNVNDWIIFNQSVPNIYASICPAQITAVDPGNNTITCVVTNNFSSGVTITPAMVLFLDNTYMFGQDRVIVNICHTSDGGATYTDTGTKRKYNTGTASQNGSGALDGHGTNWSVDMVGGDALNIGAISFDADRFEGSTCFNKELYYPGQGGAFPLQSSSTLRSWYQISFANPTSLGIHSLSVAASLAYNGRAPHTGGDTSTGTYVIKPAARALRISPRTMNGPCVICETTNSVWSPGDQVECIICPYPDVHGWDYRMANYTTGGISRYFMSFNNYGARSMYIGISIGTVSGDKTDFAPLGRPRRLSSPS
jgi:hypothetical protein